MIEKIRRLGSRRTWLTLLAILLAGLATASLSWAICEHVNAGCDDCTICQRWYMIGDDMCYENYYYCINTCTGEIDGYYDDRCEPW